MKTARSAILVLLLGLCPALARAFQDSLHYNVQHFTDENGLPQNSVKSIVASPGGFIWLTTEGGLVRYDGHSFKNFNKQSLDISSNRFLKIETDFLHPGELLTATENKELVVIKEYTALALHQSGVEGMLSTSRQLPMLRESHSISIGLPNVFKDLIGGAYYYMPAGNGSYYLAGKDSVSFYLHGELAARAFFHYQNFYSFLELGGRLYHMDTRKGAVYCWENGAMHAASLTGDITRNPAYHPGTDTLQLYWNLVAGQAFAYTAGCLYQLQAAADGIHTQLLLADRDFVSRSIVSVYYSATLQRLFLGSQTEGLYELKRKSFYTTPDTKGVSLYAQEPYTDSTVVTPTGLVISRGRIERRLPAVFQRKQSNPFCLLRDAAGCIWNKSSGRLYLFNPTGTQLLQQWEFPGEITVIYQSPDSTIWVGVKHAGLYRLPPHHAQASFKLYEHGLQDVSYLLQTQPGCLWAGDNAGLYRLHPGKHTIDTIHGLQHKRVTGLYAPGDNELWVTTVTDGLYVCLHDSLVAMPMDKNHYLSGAHVVVEDAAHYFWIATDKGLFQAAHADLLAYARGRQQQVFYLYHDKTDGFNTNEFDGGSQPNALRLGNGSIAFPSLNGLVWLQNGAAASELPDKAIYLEDALLDQRQVALADTLHLLHGFQLLKLHLLTAYYGNPYNVNLEYCLQQNKSDACVWHAIGDDQVITQTGLASGWYALTIRKQNGFGTSNYSYKRLVLQVPKAFYETGWFRLLAVLLFILVVWLYTRLWLLVVERKNRVLEARINERTASLQATLGALRLSEEKLQEQMRTQERLIATITHDVKSPLHYVVVIATHLLKQVKKESPANEPLVQQAQVIYDATYRMSHFIDNLLQYIKSSTWRKRTTFGWFDVHALINEKVKIFQGIAQANKSVIVNETEAGLRVYSSMQLTGIIIHNILDNATKFTFNGTIQFYDAEEEEHDVIIVKDDGAGMPEEVVAWSNNYAAVKDADDATGTEQKVFGLRIINELLELTGGYMRIESDRKTGTTIRLYFKKHPEDEESAPEITGN